MPNRDEDPATLPPPPGEADAYNARTRIGEMPAELMAELRAEGLMPTKADDSTPPQPPLRRRVARWDDDAAAVPPPPRMPNLPVTAWPSIGERRTSQTMSAVSSPGDGRAPVAPPGGFTVDEVPTTPALATLATLETPSARVHAGDESAEVPSAGDAETPRAGNLVETPAAAIATEERAPVETAPLQVEDEPVPQRKADELPAAPVIASDDLDEHPDFRRGRFHKLLLVAVIVLLLVGVAALTLHRT